MTFELKVDHEITLDEADEAASKVEQAVGEIATGKRKSWQIPVRELAALAQFVRDSIKRAEQPSVTTMVSMGDAVVMELEVKAGDVGCLIADVIDVFYDLVKNEDRSGPGPDGRLDVLISTMIDILGRDLLMSRVPVLHLRDRNRDRIVGESWEEARRIVTEHYKLNNPVSDAELDAEIRWIMRAIKRENLSETQRHLALKLKLI